MLSELFRRVGLNVVTTHAHFDVFGQENNPNLFMDVNLISNRSLPLLQSLVNSADFYIDVSLEKETDNLSKKKLYDINVVSSLGQPIPTSKVFKWDREGLRLAPF
jgi:hypothetical protein